jgi:sigma-E factor negative regulatory protein RseA
MTDNTAEQLSSLVDGECEVPEMELLLRRLAKDQNLKVRWQSYHLISDAIKNNIPEVIVTDFAERVGKAIEADSSVQMNSATLLPPWFKPVAGLALAASVALVVLLGLRLSQQGDSDKPLMLARTIPAERKSTEQTTLDSALQSRLNSYLVNHNEYASMNTVHGMLPYVRMVGYEPKQH